MTEITRSVDVALDVLRNGGLVAIPTETVYGLAADASNRDAVARIFATKRRPVDHPLIVHVASSANLDDWADGVSDSALLLARACWPGPLTLIVPRATHVVDIVTGGLDTVGVRVPAHPLATELLDRFGGGLAAPSANRFGKVSPTTAEHVAADLGGDIDVILDGGPCPIGVESTIVDCSVDPPQILRPGGIPNEQITALLRSRIAEAAGPSRASGMLESHYSPTCRVVLADSPDEATLLQRELGADEILGAEVDPVDYARHLYQWLREADARGADVVVAILPAPQGLGHAIRDRLVKAAATAC